jgi:polyisoprenoid-binding protein YceI
MRHGARAFTLAVALTVVAAAASGAARAATPDTRAIDPAKSRAAFGLTHVFVERVTGTVPIVSGTLEFGADSPLPSSVSAELDPRSVTSGDHDRDGALESPDFFDVKDFPVWTFASTKITPVNAGAFGVDGTLTIRGVAQAVHLDVTIKGDAAHPLFHAVGHIDRHGFKMPITRLDPAIGNTVDITLDIATK